MSLLSANPARILGLPGGTLAPGAPADVTVLDLGAAARWSRRRFESKGRCTPFAGWNLKGWPVMTIVAGQVAWKDSRRLMQLPAAVEAGVAAYHGLLEADPGAAREQWDWLREAFRREGVTFDGAPMPAFLRPHFVGRADWELLRAEGHRLLDIAARVARHVFDGDVGRLCAFLGTPAAEARWVALDPGEPDVVLSRLDAFLTGDGPRFIEVNSDAPAGFGYSDRMARVYRETAGLPRVRAAARGRLPGVGRRRSCKR